jgi:hypothetical protein
MKYFRAQRAALGGSLPQRRRKSATLQIPPLSTFQRLLESTGEREISTTMAFVQMLGTLVRDKAIGKHIVPIVPDESRTFGMEGMFRQLGIYSSVGQLYRPQDADQLMYYREDKTGQVLQEGINEGGAMSSWIVAATSYSTNNVPMIPFYIFYSMFGLQRVGDLAWLAGDMRARGFFARGHRRPHDAERGGASARGRPQSLAAVRFGDASPCRRRHCGHARRRSYQRDLPGNRDGLRAGRHRQNHPPASDAERIDRHGCRGFRGPLYRPASAEEMIR